MSGGPSKPQIARSGRRAPSSEVGDGLRSRFARNVRLLRRKRQMTQEQLATAAGLCRTFLNPLERGRHSATLETIGTLAKALDVPPERLMLAETA
jgi:transcriptional regulator with XRE-family HTH domain